jgi:hypothetical protein
MHGDTGSRIEEGFVATGIRGRRGIVRDRLR